MSTIAASPAVRHLRREVAATAKRAAADPTGGQDTQFEEALANLAHAVLKDKAPGLLPYEVGFQLIDRNDDNNKAIAVAGFKVGDQWLYAPIFFLAGEIKGQELLYLKNNDQFVPLKENWLNAFLLHRKPALLGEPVDRNSTRLGMMAADMRPFHTSPVNGYKMGAAADWADAPAALFRAFAAGDPRALPKYRTAPDLAAFLKTAGRQVVETLVRWMMADPKTAAAFAAFHDLGVVKAAVAAVAAAAPRPAGVLGPVPPAPPAPPVRVLPRQEFDKTAADLLTAAERETLVRDGVVVKDDRDPARVSQAYAVETAQRLTNPTESGLYDVLVKPGKWEPCLVLLNPSTSSGVMDAAVVARPTAGGGWLNADPSRILIALRDGEAALGSVGDGEDGYEAWRAKLPDASTLGEGSGTFVLLGTRGRASAPFRVRRDVSGPGGGPKVFEVSYDDYPDVGPAGYMSPTNRQVPPDRYRFNTYDSEARGWMYDHSPPRIRLTGKVANGLTRLGGELLVPDGYKLLRLSAEPAAAGVLGGCGCESSAGPGEPLLLGAERDVIFSVYEKTAGLKVSCTGGEVVIDGDRLGGRYGPTAALVSLVVEHGLTAAAAAHLLKEAGRRGVTKCRVKYADGYPMPQGQPWGQGISGAPPQQDPAFQGQDIFGGRARGQEVLEYNQRAYVPPGPNAGVPPTAAPPDQWTMNTAQQAAATGQKEVFDTAMIGGLLKAVRDDTMVDKHIGTLMQGLDRLGRILFSFYWHNDAFADRYGKGDMPELEDNLRNSFESLGDTILFLRQKNLQPFLEGNSQVDMGSAAN